MKKILISLLLIFTAQIVKAQYQADDVIGQYWTHKQEGKVEIYRTGEKYFGKIVWRKDARKDTENPDPELRERSVIGLEFLRNFIFDDGDWVDGEVYSIDNGGTYSGKMWLLNEGQILKMRGYLGISLLGRTATLTRVE